MKNEKKLVLIDGHSILNRAFYGLPDLTNSEGLHTNAVYGFLNILFKILEEEKPEYLAVAFDVQGNAGGIKGAGASFERGIKGDAGGNPGAGGTGSG